jgi:subtilisin family serine protease
VIYHAALKTLNRRSKSQHGEEIGMFWMGRIGGAFRRGPGGTERFRRAPRRRLAVALALGALAAGSLAAAEPPSWAAALFDHGRAAFYRESAERLRQHPLAHLLSAEEKAKVLHADQRYPRLYGLLVNIYYQRHAPLFRALLEDGRDDSRGRAEALYGSIVQEAASAFVEALFHASSNAEAVREMLPGFRGKDRVDLLLLSIGYFADLSVPAPVDAARLPPLSPEFDRQWGLDAGRFRAAHRLSQGEGVSVAVIDSGIDVAHPVFRQTELGRHFGLLGRDTAPWLAEAPTFDSGGHGTMAASVVATYAPRARITAYKKGDGDTTNNAPFPMLRAAIMAANIYRAVFDGNDIISISSGLADDDPYLRDACRFAHDNNVLIVTGSAYSLGRYLGLDVTMPAQYESTLAVTAIERREDGSYGTWDAAAADPMTVIASPNGVFGASPTYLEEPDRYVPSISAATPVVAAAAALAMARRPRDGTEGKGGYVAMVERWFRESADPQALGDAGFAPEIGYGLLDAEKLVRLAEQESAARREAP